LTYKTPLPYFQITLKQVLIQLSKNIEPVRKLLGIIQNIQLPRSEAAISEILNLFQDGSAPTVEKIASADAFGEAFGRGQQYISMVKI
jgi:hypothetical protein